MRKYLLPILVAAFAVGACSDASGPGTESVVGTYTLVSFNGTALPVVISEDASWKAEILSGSVVLNTGGSCSLTLQWRVTNKATGEAETGADLDSCTYTVSGSSVTINLESEGSVVATISGNTLAVTAAEGLKTVAELGRIGTYALISINGTAVPVVLYEDDFSKDEVLSGAVVLSTGGACTITIQWRWTDKSTGQVDTESDSFPCTYTVSGSTVTFSFFGETLVASLSGSTLTINADGEVWVFRK